MTNIVDHIFSNCDHNAIAILTKDQTITYRDLEEFTNKAASLLGDRTRQRLGLQCPNGIPHIIWSLAVLRSGACIVPVAGELTPSERDQLVTSTALHHVITADGGSWHKETTSTEIEFGATLHSNLGALPTFDESRLQSLNPALIRFSSGTTGKRKGVVLSHETLLARVRACNVGLGIGPGDRVIWTLPMAHHFAVSIVLYLLHGATTVLEESHLGADVYAALTKHQGTVLYGSPFHFALLASVPDAAPCPSLRLAVSTAAALSETTATAFRDRFQIPLTQGMGIIEQGLPLLNTHNAGTKPTSVGRPQPGFQAKIEDGELFLRGPGIFDAYLTPWADRDEILHDGWFATGDLAEQDSDGDIFLKGRKQAVINVGGMKCFPEEVEALLETLPEVAEAWVHPMQHPTFGAVPIADIIPSDPANPPKTPLMMRLCRQELSNYKIPMKYTIVETIPKTPSGKILRTS
jgi:long-chain acyl-CoA synthetase